MASLIDRVSRDERLLAAGRRHPRTRVAVFMLADGRPNTVGARSHTPLPWVCVWSGTVRSTATTHGTLERAFAHLQPEHLAHPGRSGLIKQGCRVGDRITLDDHETWQAMHKGWASCPLLAAPHGTDALPIAAGQ